MPPPTPSNRPMASPHRPSWSSNLAPGVRQDRAAARRGRPVRRTIRPWPSAPSCSKDAARGHRGGLCAGVRRSRASRPRKSCWTPFGAALSLDALDRAAPPRRSELRAGRRRCGGARWRPCSAHGFDASATDGTLNRPQIDLACEISDLRAPLSAWQHGEMATSQLHEDFSREEAGKGGDSTAVSVWSSPGFFAIVAAISSVAGRLQAGTGRCRWRPPSCWWRWTIRALLAPLNRLWLKFGLLLYKVMNPLVLGPAVLRDHHADRPCHARDRQGFPAAEARSRREELLD